MTTRWNPEADLAALRWGPDMAVRNHDGEHVWLKKVAPTPSAMHGYITDCCFIDDPCERHARRAAFLAETTGEVTT